jgi:anti-sigma factor RsiW
MNCQEARRHWNLYYDSEGTPDLFQQINGHLETCAECAAWYRRQEVLEEELTRRIAAGEPTPELWASILPTPAARPVAGGASRRLLLSLVAVLAASVLVAVGIAVWPKAKPSVAEGDLAELSSQQHRELLAGERAIDFRSSSDLEVEEFLRKRVEFPVRCPPRKDTGFMVAGAGTCRFDGQKAAYLVGKLDGGDVSIFILSRDSLKRFPRQSDLLQRARMLDCRDGDYRLAMAAIDKNLVLVIGRASCAKLSRVVQAYGTYPHGGS